MLTYKKILNIVPNNIREKFNIFDYQLPFFNLDDDYNSLSSLEKSEIYNQYHKERHTIYRTTGFRPEDYIYLVDNYLREDIDVIDLLKIIVNDRENRKFIDTYKLKIMLNDYISNFNKDYDKIYLRPAVSIKYNEDCADDIFAFDRLAFFIIGLKKEEDKIFVDRVIRLNEESEKRLKKLKEVKEKMITKTSLEQMRFFCDNYNKYKKEIDFVADKIVNKEFSEEDVINFGNIGKCAVIKINNDNL